jgi:hypothetical protein
MHRARDGKADLSTDVIFDQLASTVFDWFNVNQKRSLKRVLVGKIGTCSYIEPYKINSLAEAAGVDIAGVASSILATPTIFLS